MQGLSDAINAKKIQYKSYSSFKCLDISSYYTTTKGKISVGCGMDDGPVAQKHNRNENGLAFENQNRDDFLL